VLTQALVQPQRDTEQRREGGRGLRGPGQVAGHDQGVLGGEPRGQQVRRGARSLVAALLVERGVLLTLEAAGGVPLRLAVPPEQHPGDGQGEVGHEPAVSSPEVRAPPSSEGVESEGVESEGVASEGVESEGVEWSTNGMVGQSFQSRSRA
jgi:hypothetical protein